ncbi:hypothetical protein [Enterobacter hormaechei]|uniref:hypothetical protein n=1 Tax=Enterobacter hormaechei TaxID=158836 RepID=UPI002DB66CB5|nr:hypothetical protein [Enterobacter hormaechei]MEB7375042.1 hypothetical protein [Enterobacter hormaechei]
MSSSVNQSSGTKSEPSHALSLLVTSAVVAATACPKVIVSFGPICEPAAVVRSGCSW